MSDERKVLIVTGSRALKDHKVVWNVLNMRLKIWGPFSLRHGACRTGADHYAHEWWVLVGRDVGCDEERYPPDWTRHGNAAGPMRNAEMVRDGADEAVAFFEPGEGNKGTLDCVGKAQAAGIPTFTWGEPR